DFSESTRFDTLVARLRQRFGTDGQAAMYRAQLRSRRRAKGESLQSLYLDVMRLVSLAFPGPRSEHRDSLAIDAFLESIDDEDIRKRVHDRQPTDLDAAYRMATVMESHAARPKGGRDWGEHRYARVAAQVERPEDTESSGLKWLVEEMKKLSEAS